MHFVCLYVYMHVHGYTYISLLFRWNSGGKAPRYGNLHGETDEQRIFPADTPALQRIGPRDDG